MITVLVRKPMFQAIISVDPRQISRVDFPVRSSLEKFDSITLVKWHVSHLLWWWQLSEKHMIQGTFPQGNFQGVYTFSTVWYSNLDINPTWKPIESIVVQVPCGILEMFYHQHHRIIAEAGPYSRGAGLLGDTSGLHVLCSVFFFGYIELGKYIIFRVIDYTYLI